jgi:hypothetical protein
MAGFLDSALTLLVVGVGANDANTALATDDLAVLAAAPDGGVDLHGSFLVSNRDVDLGVTEDDATASEIIGRHFDGDLITREDADVGHPDLTADVGQHDVSIGEFDTETGVGK